MRNRFFRKKKEEDPPESLEIISEKKVMKRLLNLIESSETTESNANEKKSPIYDIMVKKIEQDLVQSNSCQNKEDCSKMAHKLVVFIESVLTDASKKTDMTQVPRPADISEVMFEEEAEGAESHLPSVETKSVIPTDYKLVFHNTNTDSERDVDELGSGRKIQVEKVEDISSFRFLSTGKIIHLERKDGCKIEVEEILNGDKEVTLVRKEKTVSESPLLKKWSTWLIESEDKSSHADSMADLAAKKLEEQERESENDNKESFISFELTAFTGSIGKESIMWMKKSEDLLKENHSSKDSATRTKYETIEQTKDESTKEEKRKWSSSQGRSSFANRPLVIKDSDETLDYHKHPSQVELIKLTHSNIVVTQPTHDDSAYDQNYVRRQFSHSDQNIEENERTNSKIKCYAPIYYTPLAQNPPGENPDPTSGGPSRN